MSGVSFFQDIPGRNKLSNADILRASIMAELDAINLYEGFAEITVNSDIRKVLRDIAREEKVHVGEFQDLLMNIDTEYGDAMVEGGNEVNKLIGET